MEYGITHMAKDHSDRKEIHSRHYMGYYFKLAVCQDSTYHGFSYTSHEELVGMRNSLMGPP